MDVRRLLGVVAGNGKALGLSETWAYGAIKAVGNYGRCSRKTSAAAARLSWTAA